VSGIFRGRRAYVSFCFNPTESLVPYVYAGPPPLTVKNLLGQASAIPMIRPLRAHNIWFGVGGIRTSLGFVQPVPCCRVHCWGPKKNGERELTPALSTKECANHEKNATGAPLPPGEEESVKHSFSGVRLVSLVLPLSGHALRLGFCTLLYFITCPFCPSLLYPPIGGVQTVPSFATELIF